MQLISYTQRVKPNKNRDNGQTESSFRIGATEQCNDKLENCKPLSVFHTYTQPHTPLPSPSFSLGLAKIQLTSFHFITTYRIKWAFVREGLWFVVLLFWMFLYHVSVRKLLKKCWCHDKHPADRFSSITLKLNICLSLCKSREGKVAKLWPSVGYSLWVCFRVILIMMTCFSLSCYFFHKRWNISAWPKLKHFPMRIITCT